MASQTERVAVHGVDVTNGRAVATLRYYAQMAHAVYEPTLERMAHEACVPAEDVVFARATASALDPARFLAVDHARRTIVLAVRGTQELADVLTAVTYALEPARGGHVHRGVAETCRRLARQHGPELVALQRQFPDYAVRVTGHSLGGAVTGVLAPLLRDETGLSVEGVAFSTPPCCTPPFADAVRDCVVSVVVGDDVVGRLSLSALRELQASMAAAGWRDRVRDADPRLRDAVSRAASAVDEAAAAIRGLRASGGGVADLRRVRDALAAVERARRSEGGRRVGEWLRRVNAGGADDGGEDGTARGAATDGTAGFTKGGEDGGGRVEALGSALQSLTDLATETAGAVVGARTRGGGAGDDGAESTARESPRGGGGGGWQGDDATALSRAAEEVAAVARRLRAGDLGPVGDAPWMTPTNSSGGASEALVDGFQQRWEGAAECVDAHRSAAGRWRDGASARVAGAWASVATLLERSAAGGAAAAASAGLPLSLTRAPAEGADVSARPDEDTSEDTSESTATPSPRTSSDDPTDRETGEGPSRLDRLRGLLPQRFRRDTRPPSSGGDGTGEGAGAVTSAAAGADGGAARDHDPDLSGALSPQDAEALAQPGLTLQLLRPEQCLGVGDAQRGAGAGEETADPLLDSPVLAGDGVRRLPALVAVHRTHYDRVVVSPTMVSDHSALGVRRTLDALLAAGAKGPAFPRPRDAADAADADSDALQRAAGAVADAAAGAVEAVRGEARAEGEGWRTPAERREDAEAMVGAREGGAGTGREPGEWGVQARGQGRELRTDPALLAGSVVGLVEELLGGRQPDPVDWSEEEDYDVDGGEQEDESAGRRVSETLDRDERRVPLD